MTTFLSVDLDDLSCYHAVHGLDPVAPESLGCALERWLPRFLDLFEAHEAKATFFVIGRELERDLAAEARGAEQLRAALESGHELANHSYAHAYDMVSWSAIEQSRDLHKCDDLLRKIGAHPVGFRAPGYTHDRQLLSQVAGMGYRYDSSALPSPSYYLAKRAVMRWMKAKGKTSTSHRGGARSFGGRRLPHFIPDLGLWEVPMSVSRAARLPLIGTTLLGGPAAMSRMLLAEAASKRDLVLELHAIDLADPELDPISPELVAKEQVLRVPLEERRSRLSELLKARGGGSTIRGGLTRS